MRQLDIFLQAYAKYRSNQDPETCTDELLKAQDRFNVAIQERVGSRTIGG